MHYLYTLLVLLSLTCLSSHATEQTTPPTSARQKIALVLSGGGARGLAHIGVLRGLKKMQVPVDIIVGTSMGAVVGGAYAAGRSPEELERIVRETDWDRVLADRPARNELDFRRKEEDGILPTRIELALTKNGAYLPSAVAGNATLELALTHMLPEGMRDQPLNELPLQFRSVASDLLTGEAVELADTPLLASLRASLAVPGLFAPVRIKQKLVVDGGLVNNLPVELAHSMGADIVIAVNVGTPLAQEKDLKSAIDIANQMLQILTEQNVQRSIQSLRAQDVLITPKLDGVSFVDFNQHAQTILAGENAVLVLKERFSSLALPTPEYLALDQQRSKIARQMPDLALPIAQIEVQGARYINSHSLLTQTGLETGQVLTQEQIRRASRRLYGRGDLEQVDTMIDDSHGDRRVLIDTKETHASRNRLRLGLGLESDFSDHNEFSLSLMHIASSLNSYGAELRSVVRIGNQRILSTEFWQPLAPASPWYVAPSFETHAHSQVVHVLDTKIAHINSTGMSLNFRLGYQFGSWGAAEIGISRGFEKINSILPAAPIDPKKRFYDTTQFISFASDTLNSLAFPSQGHYLAMQWQHSPSKSSGEGSRATARIIAIQGFELGSWSAHLYGEWGRGKNSNTPAPLGGFLRLSGMPIDSLTGKTSFFARSMIARKIGAMPTALGGPIRLGFSLEAGDVYGEQKPLRLNNLKQATSASLSIDTRFGPLYFGIGTTRGMGTTTYLYLGPIW